MVPRRDELPDGPFPKELTGLIPKVNAPEPEPPPKSCGAKFPPDKVVESACPLPNSVLAVGPAPKEADCSDASKPPTTLNVSPKLSKDWLNRLKEGAISIDPSFGLREGSKKSDELWWECWIWGGSSGLGGRSVASFRFLEDCFSSKDVVGVRRDSNIFCGLSSSGPAATSPSRRSLLDDDGPSLVGRPLNTEAGVPDRLWRLG